MNIKLSVFIATSLDGYIARYNGKLDWMEINSEQSQVEDLGYEDFYGSIDCIVMGRNTFEKAVAFPRWPFHNKRVIVLSRRWKQIPDQFAGLADLYSGKVELLTVELQNLGVKHVYVDGGITIQSFLQAGLLSDMTITTVPVILGKGLPLFTTTQKDIKLELKHFRAFDSGFIQASYRFL